MALREILEEVTREFSPKDIEEILGTSNPSELQLFKLAAGATRAQNNLPPEETPRVLTLAGFPILGDLPARKKDLKFQEREKAVELAFSKLKIEDLATKLAGEAEIENLKKSIGNPGEDKTFQFNELLKPDQEFVRSIEGVPTREVVDRELTPRLGPEQAVLDTLFLGSDEFGDAKNDVSVTPFGDKALASGVGGDLLHALVNDPSLIHERSEDVERFSRAADKGLAPSVEETRRIVEDPTGNVSEAALRQAAIRRQTELKTPRPTQIEPDALAASIKATMTASGADPSQIKAVTDALPSTPVDASVGTQIMSTATSASSSRQSRLAKFKLRTQAESALARRQVAQMQVIQDLSDSTAQVSATTVGALRNVEQIHQQKPLDESSITPSEKAKRATGKAFTQRNQDLLQKEVYSEIDKDRKNQARAELEVARGERELTYDHVQKGFELALHSAGDGADAEDVLEDYISAAMEASPTTANQYINLLEQTSDNIDPMLKSGVRNALVSRHKDMLEASVVMDHIRMINDTELFGDSLKEITSSLESAYTRLAQGQPTKGIAPISPRNLMPILEQIKKNKELETMSSQNITVKVGADEKPLKIEEAAKIMEVQQSISFIDEVQNGLTAEDGSINRGTLTQMNFTMPGFLDPTSWWTPEGIKLPKGMPFTKGREYAQILANVAELRGRLKSGAVINSDEWDTFIALYWPSLADSDDGIRNKFSRLRDYSTGLMHLVDPTGTQRDRLRGSGTKQSLFKGAPRTPRKERIQQIIDSNPNITQEELNQQLIGEKYGLED